MLMNTRTTACEPLPTDRKALRRAVLRQNQTIRAWSAFGNGFAVLVGCSIAKGVFPERSDWMGLVVLAAVLSAGFAVVFHQALVEPRIRAALGESAPHAHPSDGAQQNSS